MVKVLWNLARVFIHLFNMFFAGYLMDNWVRVAGPENIYTVLVPVSQLMLLAMIVGTSLLWQYGFDD